MKLRRILPAVSRLVLLLLAFGSAALAQQFALPGQGDRPLDPEEAFRIELLSAGEGRADIGWRIAEGYYLYRDHIAVSTAAGEALEVQTFPGRIKEDPNFGAVEVYYDSASVTLPQAGGEVRVTWQGCQEDGICYAPVTSTLELPPLPAAVAAGEAPGLRIDAGEGMLAGLAGRGGATLVLLAFFGFGLALALTPCVFPMVPILAGMLARQGERLTPDRGAVLSGAYVLAMAAAFAALGAVAGWSGQNLQMLLQSPWAVGAAALLFAALALSSFGLFDLQLPAGLAARLQRGGGRRGSVGGAAALGFTSALIVGPCVTAPLAGAFLYIAQTGDVTLGTAALFMLGLGQGAPLVIAGTFGARVLPRAGAWMETMRRLFGVVFLAMAIWLAGRILPGPATLTLWALLLTGCAVFLGTLDRPELGAAARLGLGLRRTTGIAMLFAAAVLGLGAALGGGDPPRPLTPLATRGSALSAGAEAGAGPDFVRVADEAGLSAALDAGAARPTLIYVTADWCVACRGIERSVLPDAAVGTALRGMRLLKADVSDLDAEGQALLRTLGAAGPPTMVFLDAAKRETQGSRLVGSIGAGDVVASAARAKAGD